MSIAYNYNTPPTLPPAPDEALRGMDRTEEEAQHLANVTSLIDSVDAHHAGAPNMIDSTDETLNQMVAQYRDAYAESAARRSSGIFGFGFRRGLRFLHRTRRTQNRAEYMYKVALDAAGASAIRKLDNDGTLPPDGAPGSAAADAREAAIRKHSIVGMLSGTGTRQGEAELVAEAVEQHRLMRIGQLDQERNQRDSGFRYRYNNLAARYNRLGWRGKLAVGVLGGMAATAAIAAAPISAGLTAGTVGLGLLSAGIRTGLSTQLSRRGSIIADAATERERTVHQLGSTHDRDQVATSAELTGAINHNSRRHARRNTITAAVAGAATGAALYFGGDIHEAVSHGLNNAFHGTEHWMFGNGHHAAANGGSHNGARPAASSSSTSTSSRGGTGHTGTNPNNSNVPPNHPNGSNNPNVQHGGVGSTQPNQLPGSGGTDGNTLQHLGVNQVKELQRTWSTNPDANHMLHFDGRSIHIEGLSKGDNLASLHNVQAAITFNTPKGPQMILAPIHFHEVNGQMVGTASLPKALAEQVTIGPDHASSVEIVQMHGGHKMDVFSTAPLGTGQRISENTFNHLLQTHTANHVTDNGTAPNIPHSQELITPQEQHATTELYNAFAKSYHGKYPYAAFEQFYANAVHNHALELATTKAGNPVYYVKDAHNAWHAVNLHDALTTLQNQTVTHNISNGTLPHLASGQELITPHVQKATTELYKAFADNYHGKNVAAAFESAYATAVHNHVLEVAADKSGNPVYYVRGTNNVWHAANLHQALTQLAALAKKDGYTLAS
jgi:hypothetical protein